MGIFNKNRRKTEPKVLTLYSVTRNSQSIFDAAKEELREITHSIRKTADGLEFTLKDTGSLGFSLRDDKDFIRQQTKGMAKFFAQVPVNNKQVLEQAIFQILNFTEIVGITFVADERISHYIVDAVFQIAKKTLSFVLYPSMELFTGDGKLLLSVEGRTDFETYYPIASSDILEKSPKLKPTPEDNNRYEKIITECEEIGIPHPSFMLSTQVMGQEAIVPSIEDIAIRAVAVFSCALYAECLLMEEGSPELARSEFSKVSSRYGIEQRLSEKEKNYIEMNPPASLTSIQFSWQYERCAVLLWALGFMDLYYPAVICDVGEISRVIASHYSIDELIKAASLKSTNELLEAHTRILYFDWACVEARVKAQPTAANLDPGVVQEQHYALNWLIGANGQCSWDEIITNT